ncbi:MAG: Holliday junction branch migration protein RuvA [Culturomica sp.]|jgi:Holliday junction DNA helicase RuvA|nr:Holliday junction branch migration protein RuvA [Culturomica sp.]
MFEYISGLLVEANPAGAVVDCGGIGYDIRITLNTYSKIIGNKEVILYTHQIIREDAHLLYGFHSKEERSLFRLLISVTGIGANTAGVMLSSLTTDEIIAAIQTDNLNVIKSIKGIGLKTAQRVIIELKDKVAGISFAEGINVSQNSAVKDEALSALVMLGFVKNQVTKVLDKIIEEKGNLSVEELIKNALRLL